MFSQGQCSYTSINRMSTALRNIHLPVLSLQNTNYPVERFLTIIVFAVPNPPQSNIKM